jgi:16S rRNA (cytidine1402-2'-O)-methyltransferase
MHSTERELSEITAALEEGKDVALVTDAGTPAVSDPGGVLVARAIAMGATVIPIPGASALLSALVGSGLSTDAGFRFFGFISRDGLARAEVLGLVAATREPCVLYEAPNRVQSTLGELARAQPQRHVAVARELTKIHEEFVRGTLAELAADEREWKGEVVLVLGEMEAAAESVVDEHMLTARIDAELAQGTHAKSAAERIAAWSGLPKRAIYERIIRRKQET